MEEGTERLTSSETEVYDRQIRLWGIEAQKRLKVSHVLVIGLTGIGLEVAKNLILAGVSVTIHDDSRLTQWQGYYLDYLSADSSGSMTRSEACLEKLRKLNPLSTVNQVSGPLFHLNLNHYNLVCLNEFTTKEDILNLNNRARAAKSLFCLSLSFGLSALAFFDLGDTFEYLANSKESVGKEKVTLAFSSLDTVLKQNFKEPKFYKKGRKSFDSSFFAALKIFQMEIDEEKLNRVDEINDLVQMLEKKVEIAPVCSVLGGMVGQEIIKVISKNGEPIDNFFFFDASKSQGIVKKI